jgi:hypothetical protein
MIRRNRILVSRFNLIRRQLCTVWVNIVNIWQYDQMSSSLYINMKHNEYLKFLIETL